MASPGQDQVRLLTSEDKNQVCCFSNYEASKKGYPPRFEKCGGNLVKIEDCKDDIDKDHGERSIILVRSGYVNRYSGYFAYRKLHICENHRNMFGKGFKG